MAKIIYAIGIADISRANEGVRKIIVRIQNIKDKIKIFNENISLSLIKYVKDPPKNKQDK